MSYNQESQHNTVGKTTSDAQQSDLRQVPNEWQLISMIQEHKLKVREEREKETIRQKKQLQRQWVFDQIKGTQQLPNKGEVYTLPLQRFGQSLVNDSKMDDSFFKQFSYEEEEKINQWRSNKRKSLNGEYKEVLIKKKQES